MPEFCEARLVGKISLQWPGAIYSSVEPAAHPGSNRGPGFMGFRSLATRSPTGGEVIFVRSGRSFGTSTRLRARASWGFTASSAAVPRSQSQCDRDTASRPPPYWHEPSSHRFDDNGPSRQCTRQNFPARARVKSVAARPAHAPRSAMMASVAIFAPPNRRSRRPARDDAPRAGGPSH
jgi:hypothetical protein